MLARYLLTLIENPTREDAVNSTASIKEGSTEMEQGVDVHELLADLEEQLESQLRFCTRRHGNEGTIYTGGE